LTSDELADIFHTFDMNGKIYLKKIVDGSHNLFGVLSWVSNP